MKLDRLEFALSPGLTGRLAALAATGALTALVGISLAPERVWPDLLLAGFFLVGLGLAGLVFIALHYVSGAGWGVAIRRVPEALVALLPAGSLLLALVLLVRPNLYPWFGMAWSDPTGALWFKQLWLSRPFFLLRAAIYLALWLAFGRLIVRTSRQQDEHGDLALTRRNTRLSAAFLVTFGVTFWLASFDWLMSLQPSWYSTIFGVYNFAGLFSSGLAAIILVLLWLQRLGALYETFTEQHRLDLGRLLFAFSTFWAYIWFSQFMLIWYANIPEETSYFLPLVRGDWGWLFVGNLTLNWILPFLILLPRSYKKSPSALAKVSLLVLAGRGLDLYLMTAPRPHPLLTIWELGIALGVLALAGLLVFRALREAPLVPVGDPYLTESLHYHQ